MDGLRGSEPDYRDDYQEFVDHFRNVCSGYNDMPNLMDDTVDLLHGMPTMQSCPHLFHLFKLSRLCLSENTKPMPPIVFHGADTSDPTCRLTDVLLPAQSYLSHVFGSVAECVNESTLAKYQELLEK